MIITIDTNMLVQFAPLLVGVCFGLVVAAVALRKPKPYLPYRRARYVTEIPSKLVIEEESQS